MWTNCRKIRGHFVLIPLIKPLQLAQLRICHQGSSNITWAKAHHINISPHCVATPATALKLGQSRTHVPFTAFCLNTLLKGGNGGRSNTQPALLSIFTVNTNIPSSAPSELSAVLQFLLSSLLLAFSMMAHLCQMSWFSIWLHALCFPFFFFSPQSKRGKKEPS